jgi:hypothetical protein
MKFSMRKSKSQLAKAIGCFLLCMLFSVQAYNLLEIYLLEHVKTARAQDKNSTPPARRSADTESDAKQHIAKSSRELDCFRKSLFDAAELDKCRSETANPTTSIQVERSAAADPQPKTKLIVVIEWLLIIGLAVQIFLAVYTVFLDKSPRFDRYVFHISDWAINTPPILGVLANLLSFALMLSRGGRSVEALFSSNYFFEAIVTTIIGGLFYIANLALKIVIQPRIEDLNVRSELVR